MLDINVPKKVEDRITTAMKSLRPVVEQLKSRDVSEADTVTLVKDLLSNVCGYDKYTELTSEHAIRGTYCDIVIQIKGQISIIVEVKAVGVALDEKHVKQAVDYAANQGVDWVILTSGAVWRLYRVVFGKPIDKHLVTEVDILNFDPRKSADSVLFYPFTKEAHTKGIPSEMLDRQMALSRHMIAALLIHNDNIVDAIRRELKRVAEVSVKSDEVKALLRDEVIKRDAIDGPAAEQAAAMVNKREGRKMRTVNRGELREVVSPTMTQPVGE